MSGAWVLLLDTEEGAVCSGNLGVPFSPQSNWPLSVLLQGLKEEAAVAAREDKTAGRKGQG